MIQALVNTFCDSYVEPKKRKPKEIRKTCFRNGCDNLRTEGKIYCSSQCAKEDKKERKKA